MHTSGRQAATRRDYDALYQQVVQEELLCPNKTDVDPHFDYRPLFRKSTSLYENVLLPWEAYVRNNAGKSQDPRDIVTLKHFIKFLALAMQGRQTHDNPNRRPTIDSMRIMVRRFIASYNRKHRDEPRIPFEVQTSHVPFREGTGLTPLHYAAWAGSVEMVAFFLCYGADPNARSEYGETPLHLAVAKTIKGPQYLEYRDYWTEEDWRVELLSYNAISEGNLEQLQALDGYITRVRLRVLSVLLNDGRTKVDATDDEGESALHKLQYGLFRDKDGQLRSVTDQFVKKLIQWDAKCTSRRHDNRTPLHLACLAGDNPSVPSLGQFCKLSCSL